MNRNNYAQNVYREGFTLFETLLALALTLVLIFAIQSALILHWKYRSAGADQSQESLTKLAVLEDFTTDLRLADSGISSAEDLQLNDQEHGQNKSFKSPVFHSGPEIRERFLKFEKQATALQPIGFFGNEQLLVFNICHPSYRFEKTEFLVPEERVIAWFVNRGTSITLPLLRQDQVIQWCRVETSQLPVGLIRMELDSRFELHSSLGNQNWELIDASVTAIHFTYLSSTSTVTTWNSWDKKTLPTAVSIAISREEQLQKATISLPQSRIMSVARMSS